MSDLNISSNKSSSLLYLRDDKIKLSLYEFFSVNKIFEKSILAKIDKTNLGIADIKCLLLISLNPGITFNELMANLDITKQSLNRVLRDLIKNKTILLKKGEIDSRQRKIFLNEKGKKLFEEIFLEQKKRIYNALKNSDSDSVIKFKNVLSKIINE